MDTQAIASARRSQWYTLGVFTSIAMVSIVTDMVGDLSDQKKEMKWSVSAVSIALGFTGMAIIANVALQDKFTGTSLEHGMAALILGSWAAGLSTIMRPGAFIATDAQGGIINPNLYFFSWASFVQTLLIYIGYVKQAHGIGQRTSSSSGFNVSMWSCLSMTSFIVMSSSSRIYNNSLCSSRDSEFCDRTTFAVSLGTISGFVALVWTVLGSRLPVLLDIILSFGALGAWCFGVGYITFGDDKSPTQNLGNLYFFTWGSFMLASSLTASAIQDIFGLLKKNDAPNGDAKGSVDDGDDQEADDV